MIRPAATGPTATGPATSRPAPGRPAGGRRSPRAWLLLAAAAASPAAAVGLGPLVVQGVIDGPREGFTLDLVNPYPDATEFVAYAVGIDDERPATRVDVLPGDVVLGARRGRKLLVIVDGLQAGETYHFRVCAQRRTPPEGMNLNARVCSKLSAHRLG